MSRDGSINLMSGHCPPSHMTLVFQTGVHFIVFFLFFFFLRSKALSAEWPALPEIYIPYHTQKVYFQQQRPHNVCVLHRCYLITTPQIFPIDAYIPGNACT